MNDIAIVNGKVVTPSEIFEACIGIEGGKVTNISRSPRNSSGRTIDASGLLIFPGFVDAHVHFREPAGPTDESFLNGTKAAASGGVTTIIDMPGSKPGAVLTRHDLEQKKNSVKGKAVVDYALFGAAGAQNLPFITEMADGGIVGYKTFMTSGPDYTAEDDATLLQVFEAISKTGLVSAVHAEVAKLVNLFSKRLEEQGENSPQAHPRSRPNLFENLAIERVIALSQSCGARAHIVHMSTAEGCKMVAASKKKGYAVTAETCPHYLLLTEEAMSKLGPYAKINPPLRAKRDQEALWHSLRNGVIDFIASDHAPHTLSDKEPGWTNIWKARAGNPGLETMAMLILTKCREGILDYTRAARLMSENPARVYGLFPRKGTISIGSDADFTIVDPNKKTRLEKDKMISMSRFGTLYDGWETSVSPSYTIVRGEVVAEGWEVTGTPGSGVFLSANRPTTAFTH